MENQQDETYTPVLVETQSPKEMNEASGLTNKQIKTKIRYFEKQVDEYQPSDHHLKKSLEHFRSELNKWENVLQQRNANPSPVDQSMESETVTESYSEDIPVETQSHKEMNEASGLT